MRTNTITAAMAGAIGALFVGVSAPSAAQAATYLGGCHTSDISPTAGACYGYFQKNVNGNNADMRAAQATALAALGLTGPFAKVQDLEISGSAITTIDDLLLNGATYISIHWGAGNGPVNTPGGVTGFYRLDLASDAQLDEITSNWGSLSNAVLWGTNECEGRGCGETPGGEVPEPATWAMMILGFGGVGALARRRRQGPALA